MEYEIVPGKVGLSARAPLASCAHSRHATHWLQSRLRAQDSSEMLLAYVFPLFLIQALTSIVRGRSWLAVYNARQTGQIPSCQTSSGAPASNSRRAAFWRRTATTHNAYTATNKSSTTVMSVSDGRAWLTTASTTPPRKPRKKCTQ